MRAFELFSSVLIIFNFRLNQAIFRHLFFALVRLSFVIFRKNKHQINTHSHVLFLQKHISRKLAVLPAVNKILTAAKPYCRASPLFFYCLFVSGFLSVSLSVLFLFGTNTSLIVSAAAASALFIACAYIFAVVAVFA